ATLRAGGGGLTFSGAHRRHPAAMAGRALSTAPKAAGWPRAPRATHICIMLEGDLGSRRWAPVEEYGGQSVLVSERSLHAFRRRNIVCRVLSSWRLLDYAAERSVPTH